jgi:hypothetical protein
VRLRRITIVAGLLHSRAALGCTFCYSETAEQVRKAVLGEDLWLNLAVSVLPFAVILAIALLIYGRGRPR